MSERKLHMPTLLAIMAAAGHVPAEFLEGPTRPPPKEPDENDLERIEKAKAKRERKARRGW